MKKILVINGPNINMIGIREPEIYGNKTYSDLVEFIRISSVKMGLDTDIYQSNHEGDLIDRIQDAYGKYDGIIINPGAFTHYSYAILDALKAVSLPTVEVHLSDINSREPFRKISVIREACFKTVSGLGFNSYYSALMEFL